MSAYIHYTRLPDQRSIPIGTATEFRSPSWKICNSIKTKTYRSRNKAKRSESAPCGQCVQRVRSETTQSPIICCLVKPIFAACSSTIRQLVTFWSAAIAARRPSNWNPSTLPVELNC